MYLMIRSEVTVWLLTGVKFTLKDLTSPGNNMALHTKGCAGHSSNSSTVLFKDVWKKT